MVDYSYMPEDYWAYADARFYGFNHADTTVTYTGVLELTQ